MNPQHCAQKTASAVQVLGARFMLDPVTFKTGPELGLPKGLPGYVMGRFGTIGDISAEEASDAAWCWNPSQIKENWIKDFSPSQAGALYGQICAERGRDYLDGFSGAARLVELAEKIVDSADGENAPTFTGWRNVNRPDDAEGRSYLLIQVLRELRFCRHIVAAKSLNVSPVGLVKLKSSYNINLFGWGDSDDSPTAQEISDEVESLTAESSGKDHEVLDEDERNEYVELVLAALAHADQ